MNRPADRARLGVPCSSKRILGTRSTNAAPRSRRSNATTDTAVAERLLLKYHVDLVFVGPLERRTIRRRASRSSSNVRHAAGLQAATSRSTRGPGVALGEDVVEHVDPSDRQRCPARRVSEPRDLGRAPDGSLYVRTRQSPDPARVGESTPLAPSADPVTLPSIPPTLGVPSDPTASILRLRHLEHGSRSSRRRVADRRMETGILRPAGCARPPGGSTHRTGNSRWFGLSAAGAAESSGEGDSPLHNPVGIAVSPATRSTSPTRRRRVAVTTSMGSCSGMAIAVGMSALRRALHRHGSRRVVWVTIRAATGCCCSIRRGTRSAKRCTTACSRCRWHPCSTRSTASSPTRRSLAPAVWRTSKTSVGTAVDLAKAPAERESGRARRR